MKTIAFFNNKGGVGKTTLVYHLAHMLPRLGYPTVAVDLDPQANLTSAFFDEERLESLWESEQDTVIACLLPIVKQTGDIREPNPLEIADNLWLVAGDLALARFEDRLSASWSEGFRTDNEAPLRTISAFHRIIRQATDHVNAAVALLDVGPNLGAINRAALLAADYLVIPLAPDLFSLQGLKNLGPTIEGWRTDWKRVPVSQDIEFEIPKGTMEAAGYVILQHAVRLDRPVKAFARWMNRIPIEYHRSVLSTEYRPRPVGSDSSDRERLATLRNYRSLMPMAQDARKPIFDLTAADGAIGGHGALVEKCREEFEALAERVAERCRLNEEAVRSAVKQT